MRLHETIASGLRDPLTAAGCYIYNFIGGEQNYRADYFSPRLIVLQPPGRYTVQVPIRSRSLWTETRELTLVYPDTFLAVNWWFHLFSMQTVFLLVFSVGLLYGVQRVLEYRRAIQSVGNFPGYRKFLNLGATISNVLSRVRGDPPRSIARKFQDFEMFGWDAYTHVGIWPRSTVSIVLADPAAIKEVTTHRARFPKPVSNYRVLTFFGKNIIASEGEEWKRYRKIAAPAFSEKNNKLVWDETIRIMLDLFDNVWHRAPEVSYDHCIEITLPIALFVIGVAGFGRRISWTDDLKVPEGHLLTFKDALHIVSTDTLLKIVVPNWAMGLTERTRKCRLAFEELDRYMMEMIQGRRSAEKKEERYDLFSSLLDAADGEEESKLSDRELVGNIFIFLVAGHETTAHTLCFCFAYLALYPEEQERLYRQIKDVIKDAGRLPTYEEMGSLTYSMAVFYETLRLRPPVAGVPKVSAEDTSLAISNSRGEKMTLPIPCGTRLILNIAGLQHNPRCWDDPDAFKPERFLGEWPKDAFLPFSGGARACIGRRFFETEGIAILTMLVSQYSVEIKDEPQFAQESFEERHARVLRSTQGLSTTPVRVPVTFKRRT